MPIERRSGYRLWIGGPVPRGAEGITIGSTVCVRARSADRPRLVRHEVVHVVQWSDLGYVGFLRRYVAAYLRSRLRGLSAQGGVPAHPVRDRGRLGGAPAGGSVGLSFPLPIVCRPRKPMPDLLPVPPPLGWRARLEALLGQRPLRASHLAVARVVAVARRPGVGVVDRGVGLAHTACRPSRSSRRRLRPPSSDPAAGRRATATSMLVQAAGAVVSPGVYRRARRRSSRSTSSTPRAVSPREPMPTGSRSPPR